MADATSRRIEVDAVLARECLNHGIFLQILFAFVLDVMVDGEYDLPGIGDFSGPDSSKFGNDRSGIVVGHHVGRPNGNVITGTHFLSVF